MVSPQFLDINSVLLIDGNNLLIRILYSRNTGNILLSPSELIESCAQIFLHQIILCVKKYSCNRVYVAFDNGGSLRKKAIFDEYKANRKIHATTSAISSGQTSSDPNLKLFSDLKEVTIKLCRSFNLPIFMEFGIEADDFIGIATEQLTMLGKQVIILSNDSDFLQLVAKSKVVCSIPYKKIDVSKENFTEFFSECTKSKGVNIVAGEYLFYKALVGDTSDNIDGIDRIGYKTLSKLMAEQLQSSSEEDRYLYLKDSLAYIEKLSENNTTKLEKLIHTNIDKIKRNYKLIELSSRYISANAIHMTLQKLMEVSQSPNRKDVLTEYRKIFNSSAPLELVINTVFSLKSTYSQS